MSQDQKDKQVKEAFRKMDIPEDRIPVIHDEKQLPVGTYRPPGVLPDLPVIPGKVTRYIQKDYADAYEDRGWDACSKKGIRREYGDVVMMEIDEGLHQQAEDFDSMKRDSKYGSIDDRSLMQSACNKIEGISPGIESQVMYRRSQSQPEQARGEGFHAMKYNPIGPQ